MNEVIVIGVYLFAFAMLKAFIVCGFILGLGVLLTKFLKTLGD